MASSSSLTLPRPPSLRMLPVDQSAGAAASPRNGHPTLAEQDGPIVIVARATEPRQIAATAQAPTAPTAETNRTNDIVDSILGYQFQASPGAYEALRGGTLLSSAFSLPAGVSSRQAIDHLLQDPDLASASPDTSPDVSTVGSGQQPADSQPQAENRWHCPEVPWKTIGNVFQMGLGIGVKTVGAILVIRQFADVLTYGLQGGFDSALDGSDPAADNRNALFFNLLLAVGQGIVAHKYVGRATSAALTFRSKNEDGEDQIYRLGGAHHDKLVTVLAQIPTGFTIGVGMMNAWSLSGAEFNKVVLQFLVSAVKTLVYCTGRGYLERAGAWMMPSVTYVDAQGNELSPEQVEKLSVKLALFMLPLTIVNSGYIVHALLNGTWADAMTIRSGDGRAITHPTVDLEVGAYEARLIPLTYLAMWLTARTEGCTLELGRKPARVAADPPEAIAPEDVPPPPETPPEPEAEAIAGPPNGDPELPALRMHVTTERAKEAAESITVNKFKAWWRSLVESPAAPHVYSVVTGFRIWANLGLNWSLDRRAIDDVNASDMPLGIIGLHAILIGMLELVPIRLVNGIGAQATEGTADRDLFDKLHHLFKLQDLIYVQKNGGQPPPDWQTSIIHRKLSAETLAFVEGNSSFDDVRKHVEALRDADLPRRVHQDADSAFLMYEPKYPSRAMVKEFGNIHVRMPFLPNSRVTSRIMGLADELVAPPPPADENV